jgi:hypothetical protein
MKFYKAEEALKTIDVINSVLNKTILPDEPKDNEYDYEYNQTKEKIKVLEFLKNEMEEVVVRDLYSNNIELLERKEDLDPYSLLHNTYK